MGLKASTISHLILRIRVRVGDFVRPDVDVNAVVDGNGRRTPVPRRGERRRAGHGVIADIAAVGPYQPDIAAVVGDEGVVSDDDIAVAHGARVRRRIDASMGQYRPVAAILAVIA